MSKTVEELEAELDRLTKELDLLASIRNSLVTTKEALDNLERTLTGGNNEQSN
jgi:prefoldin subunit 5